MSAPQLWFAFVLGGFTVFAPCAYPLLPGYVAYFLGESDERGSRLAAASRATGIGLLVSLGFVLVYLGLGGVVVVVGTAALADIAVLELVVGLLLVALGTAMALGRGPSVTVRLPERRRSAVGYVLFGFVYALAAAGCTALLTFAVVASALTADVAVGLLTLGAYVAGMSLVMVGLTVLAGVGRETLVSRLSGDTGRIKRVAGALLVVAGLAQIYLFLFRYDGLELLGLA